MIDFERRVELIRKKERSAAEERELSELQARVRAYVNDKYPLPFSGLEKLEALLPVVVDPEA